jgi:glycosyltransferase involved in cell wall biosynthesis
VSRLRILHVTPALSTRQGGPARTLIESLIALDNWDFECSIFATDLLEPAATSPRNRATFADLPDGAEMLDVRLYRAAFPRRFAYSRELARALSKEARRYDLLHIHSLYLYPQLAAFRAAKRTRISYVVSPHGVLDPIIRERSRTSKAINDRLWVRQMLSEAKGILCMTELEATFVRGFGVQAPTFVVPSGISTRTFDATGDATRFRSRFLRGNAGRVVLSLGRISHIKGIDILIRAFAAVSRAAPDALLVVAGPDDEGLTPQLAEFAAKLEIAHRVTFTGELLGADRLDALSAACIAAVPSKTESFGRAMLEAMAAGLPVIVSRHVRLASDIESAGAGVVCERTPEAFAAALGSLFRSQTQRAALGRSARTFAHGYDWQVIAPKLAAVYATATGSRVREIAAGQVA